MPYFKIAYPKAFDDFNVFPIVELTNNMTIAFSAKVHCWYEGLIKVHGEKYILSHVTNMVNDLLEKHGKPQSPLVFFHQDQYFATFFVLILDTGIIFMSPKEAKKCGIPIKVI